MAFVHADGSAAVANGGAPLLPALMALPASTATPVSFGQPVCRVVIQNNTAAPLYRAYAGNASLGSYAIAAGGAVVDLVVTGTLSLYAAAAATINGAATGGIVVEGYL